MRAYLLVVPVVLGCGGGSSTTPDPRTTGEPKEVAGKGTRGFDEYPQDYGANEYGEFGYDYYDGYDGYDDGYGGHGYGGSDPYVPPPPMPPDVVGTWSGGCEAGAKDSKKLTFVITATRWDLDHETFADTTCTKRASKLHVGGPYAFGSQSTTVAGAWDGTFSFDVRELTADDKKTAKALGKTCGIKKLTAGKAADLLAKGCLKLGLKPVADCAADHDVVTIDGTRLRFGVRPADNDLCTADKRPTALDTTRQLAYQWPSNGIPECDDFFKSVDAMVNCTALPADVRNNMFPQIKQYGTYFTDAATCKAGTDSMKQSTAAMGC